MKEKKPKQFPTHHNLPEMSKIGEKEQFPSLHNLLRSMAKDVSVKQVIRKLFRSKLMKTSKPSLTLTSRASRNSSTQKQRSLKVCRKSIRLNAFSFSVESSSQNIFNCDLFTRLAKL